MRTCSRSLKTACPRCEAALFILITFGVCLVAYRTQAVTRYVDPNSAAPSPPYTSWATAGTNIQNVIDYSLPGDLVLVTNGVYDTGGKYFSGSNRIAITTAITVQSVNGPDFSTIKGFQVPGIVYGTNAVRCAYLSASGAVLSGFTLRDGATDTNRLSQVGGGVYCAVTNAVVTNCVVTANASFGGGGGIAYGIVRSCTILSNSSAVGGGVAAAIVKNCSIVGNYASDTGGGTYTCSMANCFVSGNSAVNVAGGCFFGALTNCTIVGNSAGQQCGGTYHNNNDVKGLLYNCLVYYNHAPLFDNSLIYSASMVSNCCTTPLPTNLVSCIDAEPQLASSSHLSVGSPCRGAGSPLFTSGTDIDGESWNNPPSIGCDEFHVGASNPLTVSLSAAYTNVATDFTNNLVGIIAGEAESSRWEFGDSVILSNRPYAAHAWAAPGDYAVVLRAFNNANQVGVSATSIIHVVTAPTHYVALTSTNPVAPFTSWDTAATNIRDAVDVAYAGGTVLVSNGVYAKGGRVVFGAMTNRVAVTNPVTLQSLHGPDVTAIEGYQVPYVAFGTDFVRCVYVGTGASLIGFTLTNGSTIQTGDAGREQSGGGVYCDSKGAVISNCVFRSNAAHSGGGAAYNGFLTGCTFMSNSTPGSGGATRGSTMVGCLIQGNTAANGGGASGATLTNCTIADNSAYNGGAGIYSCTAYYCNVTNNYTSSNGGGANNSTLNNCTLNGNGAGIYGGGACSSTLNNCLVLLNSATNFGSGGGVVNCNLNNCTISQNTANYGGGIAYVNNSGFTYKVNNSIIYGNHSTNGAEFYPGAGNIFTVNFSCINPSPTNGANNVTTPPLFIDLSAGNFRLQTNSPCIDFGDNSLVKFSPDRDGRPRFANQTVDLGAYEFQAPNLGEFIQWLQQHGLATDGSDDYSDPDADGFVNWNEWRAGTDPADAQSRLRMVAAQPDSPGIRLTWESMATRNYSIERTSTLSPAAFQPVASHVPGVTGTQTYVDQSATNSGPYFYRVSVE